MEDRIKFVDEYKRVTEYSEELGSYVIKGNTYSERDLINILGLAEDVIDNCKTL